MEMEKEPYKIVTRRAAQTRFFPDWWYLWKEYLFISERNDS